MTLTDHIAKSLFIRKAQYGSTHEYGDPDSFHIYAPGPSWSGEHLIWNNLMDVDRAEYTIKAETWLSNVREKSPITYAYILNNFKGDNNLELL